MVNLITEPTKEQKAIIEALPNFHLLKVNAFAGTGKTTTLQLLTRNYPQRRFLYLAYNKSIQLEASKKFGKNVQVKTVHSLAYKYVSNYTNLNLQNLVNYNLKVFSEHCCIDYRTAQAVSESFSAFCNSSEAKLDEQPHQGYIKRLFELIDSGKINPSFDFILKRFHLLLLNGIAIENYDVILLDEAQDSTEVIIDIFLRMNARHKVLVGDKHQQIYSFRNSKNAMNRIDGKTFSLTKTFRFPRNVAEYSNRLLSRFKGERLAIQSDIEPTAFQNAIRNLEHSIGYISRCNSTLIAQMLDMHRNHERFKTVRSPTEIFRNIKDVGYFLHDQKLKISSYNSFLRDMADENELESYIKSTKDYQLDSTVRLFQTTFESRLSEVFEIESVANDYFKCAGKYRYFLTTAHTAKGLEFDCTVISDDFFPFERIIRESGHNTYQSYFNNIESCNHKVLDEFNLFYVALTRCKKSAEIHDNNLSYLDSDDWEYVLDGNLKTLSLAEDAKSTAGGSNCDCEVAIANVASPEKKGFLQRIAERLFGHF